MRFGDLLGASLGSLWQRKFRTALTVLGVVIGTMAVVVMVSLGTGMSAAQMEQIERNSNLRQVTVVGAPPDTNGGQSRSMDQSYLDELKTRPGVARAWGVYAVPAEIRISGQSTFLQVEAIPYEALTGMKVDFATGGFPERGGPLAFVLGDKIEESFYDPMTGMPLEVDLQNSQIYATFGEQMDGGCMGPGCPPPPADDGPKMKRILVESAGVLAGVENEWTRYSQTVLADIEPLLRALEKASGGNALPGQPATPSGKPSGPFVFTHFVLETDTMEDAEALTTLLREEQVQAYSDVEWIREMQNTSTLIQAVFGGIGAISLLVAAIGIANTMMMSVYERTKEIGVMKVLGASLGDIRKLFLLEAASIGFFGGLIGVGLSLAVSMVLNNTLGSMVTGGMGGDGSTISLIPVWLIAGALVFSTLIGTVAGLLPAQRAMKLSPLEAIRSQ